MNRDFASSLIQLNNTFYREHAASFSETRHTPWPGWVRTLDTAYRELAGTHKGEPLRIFDLACGNMRFERFLDRTLESMRRADPADPFSADGVEFYAADSCIDLANDDWSHTRHLPYQSASASCITCPRSSSACACSTPWCGRRDRAA